MVAALTSEPDGSFDRAVAASDDQDLFIDVVVGLDRPLHHLGQLFSSYTNFAGLARFAAGQNYSMRAILIRACRDRRQDCT